MGAPLLLTADDELREELPRLAAAAGAALEVRDDVGPALRAWVAADLVLVGADAVAEVARLGPPRRAGVHVVAAGPVPHEAFRDAVRVGAEDVAELPASRRWLVEVLTDAVDGSRGAGLVVGVLGGSGGVGASVLAAALAATWGETCPALLVDVDACGAGSERLLGMEELDGIRWDAVRSTTGRMSGRSLRESVPRRRGVGVLGWGPGPREPLQQFAAREVLSAGRRGHDVVVLDLPRQAEPVGEELLLRADHVVLLSGSTLGAVTAAGRSAARLAGVAARPHLVVRAGGGLTCQEVSRTLGLPLAAVTAHQRGLEEAIDLGAGPLRSRRGSVARAARDVVARLERSAALVA